MSDEVGTKITSTEEAIYPLETSDGWAKMSNFHAYGGSSVCCDAVEYTDMPDKPNTMLTDSARANSHLPKEITEKLDAMSVDVTENTDTGGFLTACLVVKNHCDAMTAIDTNDHEMASNETKVNGNMMSEMWMTSGVKVPWIMVVHDVSTL